jgi:hypothetical protein
MQKFVMSFFRSFRINNDPFRFYSTGSSNFSFALARKYFSDIVLVMKVTVSPSIESENFLVMPVFCVKVAFANEKSFHKLLVTVSTGFKKLLGSTTFNGLYSFQGPSETHSYSF